MSKRIISILVSATLVLGGFIHWFFEHLIYDVIWAFLEKHHIKQADMMTFIIANFLPFALSAIVIGLTYIVLRYEFARGSMRYSQPEQHEGASSSLTIKEPDFSKIKPRVDPRYISVADAIKYIADESEWGTRIRAAVTDRRNPLTDMPMRHNPRFAAIDEFTRAAREGELLVFGCPDQPGEHQLIAQPYWLGASIDPASVLSPGGIGSTIGISPNLKQRERITRYVELHVERSEVSRLWPRSPHAWMGH